MNFTYLDPREILECVLQPPPPIPFELGEKWKNFENELATYKLELATARRDLSMASAELAIKREDILHLRSVIDGMTNPRLKDSLEKVVQEHEEEVGIETLTQHCGELMGQVTEMEKVLKDTHAERYASYICFVCMERPVDLFMDPCGHVMCGTCWTRTLNKRECPGCRGALRDAKKIFTLS